MSFFAFLKTKEDKTDKVKSQFIISYATVENIDSSTVKLLVEVVDFTASNVSNFEHIPTFEAFIFSNELLNDIREGDLIKVEHDGFCVYKFIEICVDEGNARKKLVSDRVSQVLLRAKRE